MSFRSFFCCTHPLNVAASQMSSESSDRSDPSELSVPDSAQSYALTEYAGPYASDSSSPMALNSRLYRAILKAASEARSGTKHQGCITLDLSKVRKDMLAQLSAEAVSRIDENVGWAVDKIRLPRGLTSLPELPFPNVHTLVVPQFLGSHLDLSRFRHLRFLIAPQWAENTQLERRHGVEFDCERSRPPRPNSERAYESRQKRVQQWLDDTVKLPRGRNSQLGSSRSPWRGW